MTWYRMMTNKGWRVFPETIAKDYVSWISRNPSKHESNLEETRDAVVDMPGMVPVDRTWQEIELHGLTISIPSMDFSVMLEQLKYASLEEGPRDLKVFKLRGWLAGVILTPDMHKELVEKMSELEPSVEIIAEKEHLKFMESLRQINKESGGRVVSARALALEAQSGKDKKLPN